MSVREAADTEPLLAHIERRRRIRVKVNLLGRCMFQDRREVPCQVIDISPDGAAFVSPHVPAAGEKVIAYVDHVGRIEGTVARRLGDGFAISIEASARKRDKLADTLAWLANRNTLNLPEGRRHDRRTPRKDATVMTLPDGSNHPCRIIDMSLSGAALATKLRPRIGSRVNLGKLGARVVRHFEDGVAIEFMRIMSEAAIEQTIEMEFFGSE